MRSSINEAIPVGRTRKGIREVNVRYSVLNTNQRIEESGKKQKGIKLMLRDY